MNRDGIIHKLTYEHFFFLLKYAQELHNKNGEPIPDIGKHGIEKIKSSLDTPFQGFGGKSLYKTFNKKATALFYFLIKNHCLQNGNKRMAILSLSFFIHINRRAFDISDNGLYALSKNIAKSNNKEKAFVRIEKVLRAKLRPRTKTQTFIDSILDTNKRKNIHRIRMVFRNYRFRHFLKKISIPNLN